MGLSIHYSGKFNPEASLSEMINEVKDICEINKWKYFIFDTEFPKSGFTRTYNNNVYGICFTPPKCETISFEFLSNGRMSSIINLKTFGFSKRVDYKKYVYMVSVKTQYAGIEVHAFIIQFLRYLSKKYFINFNLADEGNYWETGDYEVLKKQFNLYNTLMDDFCLGLQTLELQDGETIEDYFKRLMNKIHANRIKGEKE